MTIVILTQQVIQWGYPLVVFLLFAFWLTPERIDSTNEGFVAPTNDRWITRLALLVFFAGPWLFATFLGEGRFILVFSSALTGLIGGIVSDLHPRRKNVISSMPLNFWPEEGESAFVTANHHPYDDHLGFGDDETRATAVGFGEDDAVVTVPRLLRH